MNKQGKTVLTLSLSIIVIMLILIGIYNILKNEQNYTREEIKIYVNGKEIKTDYSKEMLITDNDGMPMTVNASDTAVENNFENTTVNYCGNKKSKVYHCTECTFAQKTKEENKVYFNSKDEFIKSGYKACSTCKP